MLVDVMVIRSISHRHSVLLITPHQGCKRRNCVIGPVHHGKLEYCTSAGTGYRAVAVQLRLLGIQSSDVLIGFVHY